MPGDCTHPILACCPATLWLVQYDQFNPGLWLALNNVAMHFYRDFILEVSFRCFSEGIFGKLLPFNCKKIHHYRVVLFLSAKFQTLRCGNVTD